MTTMTKVRRAMKNQKKPPWLGPCSSEKQGGVTQSLMNRFLFCRQRFEVATIKGWQSLPKFSPGMHFGSMWHECEEALAAGSSWIDACWEYATQLLKEFPDQRKEVDEWHRFCQIQFPLYVQYWEKHPDVKSRKPIFQEVSFHVPFELPSGRVVYLRGKWDAVDAIGKRKNSPIFLQENKTKALINYGELMKQLRFDLQTFTYLIALMEHQKSNPKMPRGKISGVRYNVIRRCGMQKRGGRMVYARDPKTNKFLLNKEGEKYKVRQGDESVEDFAERFEVDVKARPEHYFMRWLVEIEETDIENFKEHFLYPFLQHLDLWYLERTDYKLYRKVLQHCTVNKIRHMNYMIPYGVYNPLQKDRSSHLDGFILNGSTAGLRRVTNLFPELD